MSKWTCLKFRYNLFCWDTCLKVGKYSIIGAREEQNSWWFYSMNHLHRNYAGSLPCDCYPGCSQGGSEECKEFFQGHWGKPAVQENINLKLKLNNIIYAMQRIYVKLLTDLKLVSWYNRGWWRPVVGCAGSVGAGVLVCVCGVSLDQIKLLSSNRRLAGLGWCWPRLVADNLCAATFIGSQQQTAPADRFNVL